MPPMLLLALMLCLASFAHAAVNKCKDKTGAVIYSEQPCDKVGATKIKELSKADLKGTDVHAKEPPPPPPKPRELAPLPVPVGSVKPKPSSDRD